MKKRVLIPALIIILMGCGTRLVYFHLDWLIPWYIGDYISLDSEQKNMLEKRLAAQLDWHCRTQLPVYAETLRGLGRDFAVTDPPIDGQRLRVHYTKLMGLWKVLLIEVAPDVTDIMMTASDAQVNELFSNLDKRNQKFREKYIDLPPEELNENRQKRMRKNLDHWISDLTSEQKQAVANWSSRLTPIAKVWLQNRVATQAYALELLENRDASPEFRKKLAALIVNPELEYTAAYQQKIDFNTEVTFNFIIEIDRLLTRDQRKFLLKRIESLASDFDKLSCDPQNFPKSKDPGVLQ
jgi:hypothetical protein